MERQQKRIQSDLQVESRLSTRVGPKQKTRKEAILPEKTEAILPPIPTPIPISHQVGPYRFHLIQSSPNRVWASVNECRVPNVKRYERILQRTTKLLSSRNKNDNVGVKRLLLLELHRTRCMRSRFLKLIIDRMHFCFHCWNGRFQIYLRKEAYFLQ